MGSMDSTALQNDYDIVLLDVNLPTMDGWEVLELIRRRKQTRVIMLTANGRLEQRSAARSRAPTTIWSSRSSSPSCSLVSEHCCGEARRSHSRAICV